MSRKMTSSNCRLRFSRPPRPIRNRALMAQRRSKVGESGCRVVAIVNEQNAAHPVPSKTNIIGRSALPLRSVLAPPGLQPYVAVRFAAIWSTME